MGKIIGQYTRLEFNLYFWGCFITCLFAIVFQKPHYGLKPDYVLGLAWLALGTILACYYLLWERLPEVGWSRWLVPLAVFVPGALFIIGLCVSFKQTKED